MEKSFNGNILCIRLHPGSCHTYGSQNATRIYQNTEISVTRWLEHHKYLSFWKLNFHKTNDIIIRFCRSTYSPVPYCNEVLKSIF